jgi:hypothetical protein
MGAGARFDADQTFRQARKEISDLCAGDALSEDDLALRIDAMRA